MDWKLFCSMTIDAVEPSLAGQPKYLLSDDEAFRIDRSLATGKSAAWTSRVLDLVLGEHLTSTGQWRGRGFAAIVDPAKHSTLKEIASSVCHELAHWIDSGAQVGPVSDVVERSRQLLDSMRDSSDLLTQASKPAWHNHGARFVRASCHIATRVARFKITPADLRFATGYYGSTTEYDFMASLSGELTSRSKESIAAIIATPAPKAFADFWHRATGTRPATVNPGGKPLVFRRFDRRVQRTVSVDRAGGIVAVLSDENKPTALPSGPEYLLLDGMEFRAGQDSVPIIRGCDAYSVREIVGSMRSITRQDSQLLGVAKFASDDMAQEVYRDYQSGARSEFHLLTDQMEGYELKAGQTYRSIAGPATVITKWKPLAALTESKEGFC